VLLNCVLFSSPSSLTFPLSFGPHYYVVWSPDPTCGNLPWSSTGLQHLPLLFFLLYLLPVVVLTFTHLFFVLVLYLLPLSLDPALH